MKSQIIFGCTSQSIGRYALRETVTLEKLLHTARTFEQAEQHAATMEKSSPGELAANIQPSKPKPMQNQQFRSLSNQARFTSRQKTTCRIVVGNFLILFIDPAQREGSSVILVGNSTTFKSTVCLSRPKLSPLLHHKAQHVNAVTNNSLNRSKTKALIRQLNQMIMCFTLTPPQLRNLLSRSQSTVPQSLC